MKDVTTHPMFKPLVDIRARFYDMQHDPATCEIMSYADGAERHAIANKLPRTQEDWWAKRRATDTLLNEVGGVVTRVGDETVGEVWSLYDGQDVLAEVDPQFSKNIRDHVANGLELARRYRLPRPVRDFIPEHHGTRLVTYFYRRAIQADASQEPGPFRYAGPRPQTRETAIVMLADSCEAIVRANQDRTRPAMEDLIDGILAERLAEGQLDECDLTMRELQEVAASFKATLRAVYHPRIAYPSPAPEEIARIAQRTN